MAYWDFLQMTPENQAAARSTSWGSALGQDFNPRNPNYQGFQANPRNVAQGSRVGLGSYINQGLNSLRGVFNPRSNVGGATPLMRKLAMSPVARGIGTVGRVAGLTNPVGAAAMSAWAAPKLIDALTKRDADATKSSLFGIDLTRNANEQAALPKSNLEDWGFPSGVVPGDEIQETETENFSLDPNWQHQLELQGRDEEEGILGPNKWQEFLSKITRQPYRGAQRHTRDFTPAQLNRMNALGGQYSEPLRQQRRERSRVADLLARQAAGKSYSQANLNKLTMGSRPGHYDRPGGDQTARGTSSPASPGGWHPGAAAGGIIGAF